MKTETHTTYELSFLLANESARADIEQALKAEKAEIIHDGGMRAVILAYPVKKHTTAQFGFVHFSASPEVPKKMNAALRLKDHVLRFLIISEPSPIGGAPTAPRQERAPAPVSQPEAALPRVLSNEALEEKLEEILK